MKRLLFPALIPLALCHLVGATWLKWGGMHPDCGRELLVPKEILSGGMLYRDMRYLYGPLAPFFNALLYGLFGVSAWTLFTAGIATAGLTALLVFALAKRVLSQPLAAFTSIVFLYVLAFANYHRAGTLNFIMPYTFAAAYGTLLALSSLYFLIRHREEDRHGLYVLSCFFLGLTLLAKQEIAAALLGTHAIALLAYKPRRRARIAALVAAGLAPAVCLYGYYLLRLGFSALVADNLFPLQAAGSDWQRDVMGLSAPGANMAKMAASLACTWAFCLSLIQLQNARKRFHPALVAAGLIFLFWIVWRLSADTLSGPLGIDQQYRGLPLLAIIAAAGLWLKKRGDTALLIAVFAGLLLARKVLNCSAVHYGFFLLVPGLILYHYFYLEFVPSFFPFAAPLKARAPRVALLAFFALLAWRHWRASAENYRGRTVDLATDFGSMRLADDNSNRAYASAIAFITKRTPPGSTLLAIPESLTLNFFCGRARTLPLEVFEPSAFHGSFSVPHLLEGLQARSPDFLAIPYGPGEGLPPGTEAMAEFFAKRYRLVEVIESAEPGSRPMRINLLERAAQSSSTTWNSSTGSSLRQKGKKPQTLE